MKPPSQPRLRQRSTRTLLLCSALYLLACAGCATFQRRFIYFPPVLTSEQAAACARSENLERWQSPDGSPIGWKRLSPARPAQGQVLILHGNADCAFHGSHYAAGLQQAAPLDVFMVEYPGYADRPGTPSQRSLEAAASEAFQLLSTNSPIYLVGESLGTGVACFLAGHYSNQVAGLALLAPYNRLTDVAQAHMPLFPVRWLLCERFPAEDYLRTYHGPLAVLVAGQDTVVPEEFGRRLYEGYSGPKRLWQFPQATHDSLMFQPPETWKQIVPFWQTNRPH
ncbi:MAG TPA: alpha/beta fold hydrolase [Bacillota bacterium]|nr:alpha/beta fold hydrolase [Bacillota bacterium]